MKFELDDKEFMKTEDIAVFCTTPGGRRRDDMNFYTSGMKVREIKEEKPSFTSARVIFLSVIFISIIDITIIIFLLPFITLRLLNCKFSSTFDVINLIFV